MKREERELRKIARLYYDEGLNLKEISARLSVSTATVSRSLSRARDLGIVRISISEGDEDFTELEVAVAQRFNLAECLLTRSADGREATYANLAEPLGALLSRALPPSGLLGVSWGETLKTVASHLQGVQGRGVDVVPTIGAMGTIETGIYPNGIAQGFARALGGNSYLVNAPAVLDSVETAEAVRNDSAFLSVAELWARLDLVLLGASSLSPETSLGVSGVFSPEELQEMRDAGGECIVNFVVLDGGGRIVDHPVDPRIIKLPTEQLRKVPRVVVIAAGPDKVEPIRVSLASGFVTTLVTDVETARGLTEEF